MKNLPKLPCKDCPGLCCKMGKGVYLHEFEIDPIERLLRERGKNPSWWIRNQDDWFAIRFGRKGCPFLEDGECSAYKNRPLKCVDYRCIEPAKAIIYQDIKSTNERYLEYRPIIKMLEEKEIII